jgi:hypothetical protein
MSPLDALSENVFSRKLVRTGQKTSQDYFFVSLIIVEDKLTKEHQAVTS